MMKYVCSDVELYIVYSRRLYGIKKKLLKENSAVCVHFGYKLDVMC